MTKIKQFWKDTEHYKEWGLRNRIKHFWSICRYETFCKLHYIPTSNLVGTSRLTFGYVDFGGNRKLKGYSMTSILYKYYI